jgi:hypothetical protein
MAKFRKKQVEVEAFRWGVDEPPAWLQDAFSKGKVELCGARAVIETPEEATTHICVKISFKEFWAVLRALKVVSSNLRLSKPTLYGYVREKRA